MEKAFEYEDADGALTCCPACGGTAWRIYACDQCFRHWALGRNVDYGQDYSVTRAAIHQWGRETKRGRHGDYDSLTWRGVKLPKAMVVPRPPSSPGKISPPVKCGLKWCETMVASAGGFCSDRCRRFWIEHLYIIDRERMFIARVMVRMEEHPNAPESEIEWARRKTAEDLATLERQFRALTWRDE